MGPLRRARALPRVLGALVIAAWLALPRPAQAWHSSGHMQIALLAYDALSEPTQQRLLALLRQHPRFEQDFQPLVPASLSSEAARARWLFAYAATWPDVARGQPEYHHGSWHWVNLPLTLKRGQLCTCSAARKDFPDSVRRVHARLAERAAAPGGPPAPPAPPADNPAQNSLLDALPRMRAQLHDETAPAAERALALTWVLHLVADAHQPLHAVALFSTPAFETGDRGGNEIAVRERGNLHALWDGVLGGDEPFDAVERALSRLRSDRALDKPRKQAQKSLALDTWLDEDCALARSFVYVPAVLAAVQRFEAGKREGKPELSLKAAYVAAATRVARERAVQAGVRLAAWLQAPP